MAKRIKNAAEALAAYQRGLQGASQAYQAGTAAVVESPMAKAAQNLEKAAANYTAAVNSGQMADALNSVTLASWKQSCQIGATKLAAAGSKAGPKYQQAYQANMPIYQAMQSAADGAGDDGASRAAAAIRIAQSMGKRGKAKGL